MGLKSGYSLIVIVALLVSCTSTPPPSELPQPESEAPLSFRALQNATDGEPAPIERTVAIDGISLAYRAYVPERPIAALILYHGGGAHSGAGYQHIGVRLSEAYGIATYTPDIRGHGRSAGPRGDASNTSQVFRDVGTMIACVRAELGSVPLFLGGHSSGAGLILNYSSLSQDFDGFVALAPHFGFRSRTIREDNSTPFAEVETWSFVVNAMTLGALFGHRKSVQFNYPQNVLNEDTGLVAFNTVNMANALTPGSPARQLRRLEQAVALWIGENDEVLDAARVVSYVEDAVPNSDLTIVEGENHLSILISAADLVGPWIAQHAGQQ